MLSVHNTEAIRRIETAIGYTFRDKRLLVQVFTRKTYMKIDPEAPDNEVLEFYGDMLLSYHVTTYFVDKFAHMLDDGLYFMRTVEQFTEMRSHYVRNQYLTERIKQLIPNIERLVRAQNPRTELPKDNQKAYADLFESLVGAVYLDSWRDDKLIRAFILRHLNLEPKMAEEAPVGRGIRTLPRVDISGRDETDGSEALTAEDDDGLTDEAVFAKEEITLAVPVEAEPEALAEEPDQDMAPANEAPNDRRSKSRPIRVKVIPVSDTAGGESPVQAVAAEIPAPVTAPEPTDEPASVPASVTPTQTVPTTESSETAPDGLTRRAELEAYCRAAGYEAPVFAEAMPNAPNARPVASCTLKYRDGRGKPVKISLNDSGRTPEEAMEKVAAKMLKKLSGHAGAAVVAPAEVNQVASALPSAEVAPVVPVEVIEVPVEAVPSALEVTVETDNEAVTEPIKSETEAPVAVAEDTAPIAEGNPDSEESPTPDAEALSDNIEQLTIDTEEDTPTTVEVVPETEEDIPAPAAELPPSDTPVAAPAKAKRTAKTARSKKAAATETMPADKAPTDETSPAAEAAETVADPAVTLPTDRPEVTNEPAPKASGKVAAVSKKTSAKGKRAPAKNTKAPTPSHMITESATDTDSDAKTEPSADAAAKATESPTSKAPTKARRPRKKVATDSTGSETKA